VPIRYGLFRFSSSEELQYLEARASTFPNSDDAVLGGCVLEPEQTTSKNVCRTCNATRDAWHLRQTNSAPSISALRSSHGSVTVAEWTAVRGRRLDRTHGRAVER
jgi:hypothetical protein